MNELKKWMVIRMVGMSIIIIAVSMVFGNWSFTLPIWIGYAICWMFSMLHICEYIREEKPTQSHEK